MSVKRTRRPLAFKRFGFNSRFGGFVKILSRGAPLLHVSVNEMSRIQLSPGLQFFGNLVDLDCHIQDLKLVLRKTEEIEFPDHEGSVEGESLIADIFS